MNFLLDTRCAAAASASHFSLANLAPSAPPPSSGFFASELPHALDSHAIPWLFIGILPLQAAVADLQICFLPGSSFHHLRTFQTLQNPICSSPLCLHCWIFLSLIPCRNQLPKFLMPLDSHKPQAHTSYFPRFAPSPRLTPGLLLDFCAHLPNLVPILWLASPLSEFQTPSKRLLKALFLKESILAS